MSAETSPSTGRRYGVERACGAGGLARSTFYAAKQLGAEPASGEGTEVEGATEAARAPTLRAPLAAAPDGGGAGTDGEDARAPTLCVVGEGTEVAPKAASRRGPKPSISDDLLLEAIRQDIDASPFVGEGYRKVWRRLRRRKDNPVSVSRKRVLRVMREAKLLSPHRLPRRLGEVHDGHIITDAPNLMWGTDGLRFETVDEGWAWVFVAVEHWNAECVGAHVTKTGDRFAALEPIKQGLERYFGGARKAANNGSLAIRSDHGSQYTSEYFIKQLAFWGLAQSFAFVRQPETNGVAERFNRTLKEQVFHGRVYRTIAEAREAVRKFVEMYNAEWLIEKNGLTSPLEHRRWFEEEAAKNRAA